MEVKGSIACVTGGASGLGRATAKALAANGAKVAVLDRDEAGAESIAAEIGGLGIACDVSLAESVEAAMASVERELGAPRILVNCAGIAPGRRIISRQGVMPLEAFRQAIEINLIGTFNVLRLFAEMGSRLEAHEGGERAVAINTASIAGYEGQVGQTAYAASKGGIIALTLPAARDLAPFGIRVCAIAPGIFETPMLRGLSEAAQKSLDEVFQFPSRLGRAEEYAALVLHIVQNQMLNGETIRLDGAVRLTPK